VTAVYLNDIGALCALGGNLADIRARLFSTEPTEGVAPSDRYTPGQFLHLGCVDEPLPSLARAPLRLRSRNNALAAAALLQIRPAVDDAIARFGPHRVAVVLGTSTSGVEEGEQAARHHCLSGTFPDSYDYAQQEMVSPALFVATELGICGPTYVVSTACSSGAKALASGARLLRAGLADAVVAGGVDALCSFTIAGFSALEAVSEHRCNPFSRNRKGINLGEGAALFLMSRQEALIRLAGWGETSDAYHMSAPDPTARGAVSAMRMALDKAGVAAHAVDYVNLHGTATWHNDIMESAAVAEVLGCDVAVSSSKPLTGHALAAAGAIEAALASITLVDNPCGRLPPHWWDGEADPALSPLHLTSPSETLGRPPRYVLSNSFAFGGSNAALLLARE